MNFDIVYAKDITNILQYENTKLVDIRSSSLYEQCHLENAINLPFDTTDNYEKILDKNIYYIFMCKCQMFADRFGVPKLSGMLLNDLRMK